MGFCNRDLDQHQLATRVVNMEMGLMILAVFGIIAVCAFILAIWLSIQQ